MKTIQLLFVSVLLFASVPIVKAQQYNYKLDGPFTATQIIYVNGQCIMCKHRIEKAVKKIPGVWYADWDTDTKKLLVKYHRARVSALKIEQAVAAVGHDTKNNRAQDSAYTALPDCCRYQRASDSANAGQ